MRKIIASAPGKIHLSGEHSVVYGQPALLAAIDKRLFVSLEPRQDRKVGIVNNELKTKRKKNSLADFGIKKIYQLLNKQPKKGFDLEIKSQLPIGAGLGSSAALAVALTGAVFVLEKEKFDKGRINQIAYQIEKKQHGNPSGGDNTISTYGGLLRFQKVKNKFNFKRLEIKGVLQEFLLVDSGRPEETTGEMVGKISSKIKSQNSKLQLKTKKLIRSMGKLTDKFIHLFRRESPVQLFELIKENEKFLEKLGVVSEKAKKIINLVEKRGGAAKICGAGGISEGSGMILAYHPEIERFEKELMKENLPFEEVGLEEKGVKIESN